VDDEVDIDLGEGSGQGFGDAMEVGLGLLGFALRKRHPCAGCPAPETSPVSCPPSPNATTNSFD
jgi:hypothetical protein